MRRFWTLFLTLCLLASLAACARQTPPETVPEAPVPEVPAQEPPAEPDRDCAVYDCGGIEIALPAEHLDQLIVDTDFPDAPDSWRPLMSVYERASVEAAEAAWGEGSGMGFLFGFLTMDQAGYERLLCEDVSGMEVIAVREGRYYVRTFPTDVRFYRLDGIDTESKDWRNWETLGQMEGPVTEDMIRRNDLTPYDGTEFFSRSFTWEGVHTYLGFCLRGGGSYGEYDGELRYVLALSQPVRQGEGGIWCVDRWMYEGGSPMVYFPDSGLPAAEYYAQIQAECDGGEHPELLTPAGAAAAFIRDYFGTEPAAEDLWSLDGEEEARSAANFRLRELVTRIRAGEDVGGMELLECLGRVWTDNWASLAVGTFGLEDSWWSAFLTALEDAAIGENQRTRDRDMMAFCLAVRGDLPQRYEAVAALVRAQREADGEAFAAALADFSQEEQMSLKPVLDA